MRAFVLVLAFPWGCGDPNFEPEPFGGDPRLVSWEEGDRVGMVRVSSGDAIMGETKEPQPYCEISAEFAVAESDGGLEEIDRIGSCRLLQSAALADGSGIRAADAGTIVVGLEDRRRSLTFGADFGSPVVVDCVEDVGAATTATAESPAAEGANDEVPGFSLEVGRPVPIVIDEPVATRFPVAVYGEGDLTVRWSGGLPADGVEIVLQARPAEDDGDGVLRCWVEDDGEEALPAELVDPFRDDISVLTVSRIARVIDEVEGWDLRLAWAEARATGVFPYTPTN